MAGQTVIDGSAQAHCRLPDVHEFGRAGAECHEGDAVGRDTERRRIQVPPPIQIVWTLQKGFENALLNKGFAMSEASNSCISRNVISSTLVPGELTDLQLDGELTIAASAPGRLRFKRYEELLSEALARGLVSKSRSSDLDQSRTDVGRSEAD